MSVFQRRVEYSSFDHCSLTVPIDNPKGVSRSINVRVWGIYVLLIAFESIKSRLRTGEWLMKPLLDRGPQNSLWIAERWVARRRRRICGLERTQAERGSAL